MNSEYSDGARNILDLEVTGKSIEGGVNSYLKVEGASCTNLTAQFDTKYYLFDSSLDDMHHTDLVKTYSERISSTQPMKSNKLMLLQASEIIVTTVPMKSNKMMLLQASEIIVPTVVFVNTR